MKTLNSVQEKFIALFSESQLAKQFYLSGGTALSEFYFQHRLSEDLDFFSFAKFDVSQIQVFIENVKHELSFKEVEYKKLYDRNIYIFKNNEILKTEFTFYPFKQIETNKNFEKLQVDSLADIGANKIMAILDRNEIKDFVDLFFFFKQGFSLLALQKLAEQKFEMKIDSVSLGSSVINFRKLDFESTKLLKKIEKSDWEKTFRDELNSLQVEFLK